MRNYFVSAVFAFFFSIVYITAQPPSAAYEGGDGDGAQSLLLGSSDSYINMGNIGDGYSAIDLQSADVYLSSGNAGDGYDLRSIQSSKNFISTGNIGDGYSRDELQTTDRFTLNGGVNDGYDLLEHREPFIWTGTVGTGWNVVGNWNYNIVPDINRPVIIPAGVPRFPFVNAGIFAIGSNPNNGAFTCHSLWIQTNADLTTRINSKVENRGVILIDGDMFVKRTASDALMNTDHGEIRIKSGGRLILEE